MRNDVKTSKILKALSNSMRIMILRSLHRHGSLSFSELMRTLGMDPRRDTGRFGYHLKQLTGLGIITVDRVTGEYRLTEVGKYVVELMDKLNELVRKEKRQMLVRTSFPGMEEFSKDHIIEALTREANMPHRLAEEIALELEKRLLKLNIKYLTASLIRELINAILVEKGYEEYRHALTRLGMPVYDARQLVEGEYIPLYMGFNNTLYIAGRAVLREYALLRALPQYVADAYLSGLIHIPGLGKWLLYPDTICHDPRLFLMGYYGTVSSSLPFLPWKKASTLKEALGIILRMLLAYAPVTGRHQVVDHFNFLIAPYIRGIPVEDVARELRLFIEVLSQICMSTNTDVVLSLDLGASKHLLSSELWRGTEFRDYLVESLIAFKAFIIALKDECDNNGLPLKPLIYVKLYDDALQNEEFKDVLNLVLNVSKNYGLLTYVNMKADWQGQDVIYDGDGLRLDAKECRSMENLTFRTGLLGSVSVNLPRVIASSTRDEDEIMRRLESAIESSLVALSKKREIISRRLRFNHLPLLSREILGTPYFQVERSAMVLNLVGLIDAVSLFSDALPHEMSDARAFMIRILRRSTNFMYDIGGPELVLSMGIVAVDDENRRFAEMDYRKYPEIRKALRGRRAPYYLNDYAHLPVPLRDLVKFLGLIQNYARGGHIANISLAEPPPSEEALFRFLCELTKNRIGLVTFSRDLTFCKVCSKLIGGYHSRCPICSFSGSQLVHYGKLRLYYELIDFSPYGKKAEFLDRYRYIIL
ncbi:MAG: helix-turn-helix domain-containing protein [Thermoprotei archaeon]|nr:helix-turn-helix domain-containing protein [Thermoprotei archaeon]